MDLMKVSQPATGMWPTAFDLKTGMPINSEPELTITMHQLAESDSSTYCRCLGR